MPQADPSSPASIRARYEGHGAEAFYRDHGDDYRNPHEPAIRDCLWQVLAQWHPDLTHVLDLAAGSGEVTLALREVAGAKLGSLDAIDPFTAGAYQRRTGQVAEKLSFEEIAAGALAGRTYSLIACSFALHLCDPSRLPRVAWALAQAGRQLLIVTPHKRPIVRKEWGWTQAGEWVVERVRARAYECRRDEELAE